MADGSLLNDAISALPSAASGGWLSEPQQMSFANLRHDCVNDNGPESESIGSQEDFLTQFATIYFNPGSFKVLAYSENTLYIEPSIQIGVRIDDRLGLPESLLKTVQERANHFHYRMLVEATCSSEETEEYKHLPLEVRLPHLKGNMHFVADATDINVVLHCRRLRCENSSTASSGSSGSRRSGRHFSHCSQGKAERSKPQTIGKGTKANAAREGFEKQDILLTRSTKQQEQSNVLPPAGVRTAAETKEGEQQQQTSHASKCGKAVLEL
eukprot:TRINITY_DN67181_c0_g1_i1.p1 TRINITY_DN67181_c0_g1~~TRINITY_DN67181_c0_g1_i1.p1  ORF type:complete len:277 (+),score=33.46 TRINITY_DN67181_c0_g1_i1:27-833(+)